jgi:hypothetical protein
MFTVCSKEFKIAIHRLDKLTSGLILLAKGMGNTTKYQKEMKELNVHKKYLARVSGHPPEKFVVDKPMFCSNPKHSRHAVAITEAELAQAKPAKTTFTLMWYDEVSDTSLVLCEPETGRTHQIRVHLQFSGHSIINDVNYGGRRVGNVRLDKLRKLYPEESASIWTLGKRELDPEKLDENGVDYSTLDTANKKVVVSSGGLEGVQGVQQESTQDKTSKEAQERFIQANHSNESGQIQTKAFGKKAQPSEEEAAPAGGEEDEGDEMEMKMFFNYGDLDKLPYTPFNEDRMMEIWLHSSQYTILGKSMKAPDPYWVAKEVLWASQPSSPLHKSDLSKPSTLQGGTFNSFGKQVEDYIKTKEREKSSSQQEEKSSPKSNLTPDRLAEEEFSQKLETPKSGFS